MKSVTLLSALILGLCASAQAGLYSYSSIPNLGVIPDANLSGLTTSVTSSAFTGSLLDVQVTLNISGGWNGDLYAYLSHDGVLVPLLTRVGTGGGDTFGFSTSGMNVTLADGAALNIHNVTLPSSGGTYAPDGQHLDTTTLQPDGPSTYSTLASFDTTSANGDWTLFFADTSGGSQSTITSWSLDLITAVPEPINVALGVFGGLFLVGSLCRSERMQKLFGKTQTADVE